jgi:probable F420-dependent oxidoreductase
MEFGVGIPQVVEASVADVERLHVFLRRAEELGFASAWVLEQPVGPAPALEPLTVLAHAAAVTRTIRLGTAVVLTPLRIPVVLAKEFATVDHLSGGRLIAGVALGGEQADYPAFGISHEGRVRRFVEGIEILLRLWTEPAVTYEGEFYTLHDARVEPKPVQRPHPPLWFGGESPAALRRATRLGDGWIGAGSTSTKEFREGAGLIRQILEEASRDPGSFPIAKRVYLAVDDDEDRAHRRLQEWFRLFYGKYNFHGDDMVDRVAVYGGPDRVAESLAAVRDAGAGMLLLNTVFDQREQLEVLASEIVPRL